MEESSKLAECVGKTRSLLKKILSEGMDNCLTKLDNDPQGYLSQPLTLLEAVLQECHNTFTACFHSFYPTPALQWACLCDLLNCLDQVSELLEILELKLHYKVWTHQTDATELALIKADCVIALLGLCRGKKTACEHTERTTADFQLACVFCICEEGDCYLIFFIYIFIYMCSSERETRTAGCKCTSHKRSSA